MTILSADALLTVCSVLYVASVMWISWMRIDQEAEEVCLREANASQTKNAALSNLMAQLANLSDDMTAPLASALPTKHLTPHTVGPSADPACVGSVQDTDCCVVLVAHQKCLTRLRSPLSNSVLHGTYEC